MKKVLFWGTLITFMLGISVASFSWTDEEAENSDVFPAVKTIVAEKIGISEDDITVQSNLRDLGADDLSIEEIALAVEEQFKVTLPENRDDLPTIFSIVAWILDNNQ